MSADDPHSPTNGANRETSPRNLNRRSSITQAALSNLFQMGGQGSSGTNGPPLAATQPSPAVTDPQRRRLSVNTLGLSGASAGGAAALGIRRGSMSASSNHSDSIDENAVEDDDAAPRPTPSTPFARRMSYGGSSMRAFRPGGSPGSGNGTPSSPPLRRASQQQSRGPQTASVSAALASRRESVGPASGMPIPQASKTTQARQPSDNGARPDQQGFNWSEQLRSRAESNVAGGPRSSFSKASSPPRPSPVFHDRAKSVSDLPPPPAQAPAAKPPQQRPKPDAFQERILKGDFYMD